MFGLLIGFCVYGVAREVCVYVEVICGKMSWNIERLRARGHICDLFDSRFFTLFIMSAEGDVSRIKLRNVYIFTFLFFKRKMNIHSLYENSESMENWPIFQLYNALMNKYYKE